EAAAAPVAQGPESAAAPAPSPPALPDAALDEAIAEASPEPPALPDAALEPPAPEPLAAAQAGELPAPDEASPPPSMTQPATVLAVALAEAELAESSNRPDAAAAALRRALDLVPARDAGRADLARRLAAACQILGDDDGAL